MPNSGEITEDYPTYAKHMLTAAFIGFIFGVIAMAVGVYTTWYQQAGASVLDAVVANPLIPVAIGGASILSIVVYSKINKFKRSGGENKK